MLFLRLKTQKNKVAKWTSICKHYPKWQSVKGSQSIVVQAAIFNMVRKDNRKVKP